MMRNSPRAVRVRTGTWFVAATVLAVLTWASAATWAVTTAHWVHDTEADFKAGRFDNVVVTNLGDVKLSRAVTQLLEQDPKLSAVYAMAETPDHTVYAGTGPQGILLAIRDHKVSTAASLGDGVNIFSLAVDPHGGLLIGTGGERGQILRMAAPGQAPQPLFTEDGVQYVWAIVATPDGMIYAATGPEGRLYEIKPDGSHRVLLDSDERNLLCMIGDGRDLLYVGTDPNGLVFRVNRKSGQAFVLYDAPESEVAALARDSTGNLYAATAQVAGLNHGGEEPATAERIGRPEGATRGAPIPAQPPANPQPPSLPEPNPGEPEPIPKAPAHAPAHSLALPSSRAPLNLAIVDAAAPDRAVGADEPGGDEPGEPEPNPPGGGPSEPEPSPSAPPPVDYPATQPPNLPGAFGARPSATPGGNAIYRIDPEGFVSEVFRGQVTVLSLLDQHGTLLAGTGDEGHVYQVNPAADETLVLAKVDPKQVTALFQASDGTIYLGLSNVGGLATMGSGYAASGTYTSPVLDATQISRFGKIAMTGRLPAHTTLAIQTRSGNVHDPVLLGWSPWSDPVAAAAYVQTPSPNARFLQYRLRLQSADGTASPLVDHVDVAYEIPNLPPRINYVRIQPAPASAQPSAGSPSPGEAEETPHPPTGRPTGQLSITWEARDPNDDPLKYALYYRLGSQGPWILLKDKLTQSPYVWDARAVADGRYYIKVEASDADANEPATACTASRVSDAVVVDNTGPVIGDLTWQRLPGGVHVRLRVVDHTSTVAQVQYAVDANDNWQAVPAVDRIYDSPDESVRFDITGMSPGPHQVAIRATDSHGNPSYESLLVTAGNASNAGIEAGANVTQPATQPAHRTP